MPQALAERVLGAESSGDPHAVSKTGAQGLMQLEPGTAKEMGVTDPFDPTQNINGGIKYLGQLLKRYSGNVTLALAAFNAGPGAVDKYHGVPPYPETQAYIATVLAGLK